MHGLHVTIGRDLVTVVMDLFVAWRGYTSARTGCRDRRLCTGTLLMWCGIATCTIVYLMEFIT